MMSQICIRLLGPAVKQHAYAYKNCVAMRPHSANHDALIMTYRLPHLPSNLPDTLRTSTIAIVADLQLSHMMHSPVRVSSMWLILAR